jgi:hypothetical protein
MELTPVVKALRLVLLHNASGSACGNTNQEHRQGGRRSDRSPKGMQKDASASSLPMDVRPSPACQACRHPCGHACPMPVLGAR